MGAEPVRFDGNDLYQPGYYGKRNTEALNAGGATASNLVLIGECKAGIPYNATADYPNSADRINYVSNTTELNSVLRDGPGYYGALFALTPSNQAGVGSPSKVGVVRINKATKGSSIIVDVDTDNVIDLKSKDYGLYTNQIRRKISAGTIEGKKISVKFETQTVEGDDITYNLFTLQYTGTGTACALTLDPAGNLTTTVTAGPGGEDLSIDLTSFDTVANLVAFFETETVYSAILTGDGTFAISKLDKVIGGDSVNIKTSYTVRAILQAVIDWFNQSSVYLIASLSASAENRIPANDADYVFLSGGSEGATPAQQDWQDAIDQILAENDISLCGVMTPDPAVHAYLSSHVTFMSGLSGRNERQAIIGSDSGDAKADKIAEVAVINNPLVGYAGTEIKRYDKNGDLKLWDGYYYAALLLGMAAGNDVTFAFTNKQLNIVGTKEKYSSSVRDDYIKAGIIIADTSDAGGIRTIRSITSYQAANKIDNEFSAVRTSLFIVKDHRIFVEELVGLAGDATALESVRNRAENRLDTYVEKGYLVVDPQFGDAYRNFQFAVEADVIKISYEGTLVLPINFILVTHNFTVIGVKK
jgi:hypothetical protein